MFFSVLRVFFLFFIFRVIEKFLVIFRVVVVVILLVLGDKVWIIRGFVG